MSSGSPSQIVRWAGSRQPGSEKPGCRQLPLKVVERCVESGLGRLLALDRSEPLADVLQCERVVPHDAPVLVHELDRRLRRLPVALDRCRLAVSCDALVGQGDVDDVRVIGRLARDDEHLGELESHDAGLDLHPPKLPRGARDGDDVGDDVTAAPGR
jgi:hypothetical protein